MLFALMIEDDPDITTLLVNFLKSYGIALTALPNPAEGLELLSRERFDFIILDLTLPQMDGLEVCRAIRTLTDVPIIISSARSDIRDK
ncbi:MAG: response regulator, partial [Campylobacterota bacterium]